ncbi:MAG: hypothetical protein ABIP97_01380, partial [Chthoniobacterales bacterium]
LFQQCKGDTDVVFNAAALSDFTVSSVEADGVPTSKATGKISSATKSLIVRLTAAQKLLPLMRTFFPVAKIVGWKFEVNGVRQAAISRGNQQILSCHSAACVVNGPAYGEGFGFLEADHVHHVDSKQALAAFCADWVKK